MTKTAAETAAHIAAIESYLFLNGRRLTKRVIAQYGVELRRAKAHLMSITAPAAEATMGDDDLLAALAA